MAAAAAALVLAGGVGFLASAGDGSSEAVQERPPGTPSTTTTPPASTEPPDEGALRPDGEPMRGSGAVVAVSPDGKWLYVVDADPRGGPGCDGYPRQQLFVEPADGPLGRDRRPALAETLEGWATLTFGPGGSVAVTTMCQGSPGTLGVGSIAEDGAISGHRPLAVRDDFAMLVDLAWASSDALVVSTYGLGPEQGEQGRGLYEIDVVTGEITALEAQGVMLVEVTADGELVTRDNVGTVRAGDEVLGSEGQVHGMAVSEDGRFVVTAGAYGVTVYDRETGAEERIADTPAYAPSILGTDDVVFHTRTEPDGVGRVVSVHLGALGSGAHAVATLFRDEGNGRLATSAVAPDGSRLWITYVPNDGERDLRPVLLAQPLGR